MPPQGSDPRAPPHETAVSPSPRSPRGYAVRFSLIFSGVRYVLVVAEELLRTLVAEIAHADRHL
jgi:hypothetical protein